ncbi:MAG: Stealth CR1 domain-containing protein [Balneolia bacterium]|nr:Stealth CR1 domain-containing protein [Balneolia bacterium]
MRQSADSAAGQNDIDAVITWVNGSDPEHQAKRSETLGVPAPKGEELLITGKDETRFKYNGELMYCLQSLRSFAPWLNTIWLVTDNQRPDFLTVEIARELGVKIIDHKDLFKSYEWCLPTFNNRTIESALWRIPGLASRFIYLNDDFVISRPVSPADFYDDSGKVILRGEWRKMMGYGPVKKVIQDIISKLAKKFLGITRSLNLLLQSRSAALAGFEKKYFMVPHVPHPLYRDSQKEFFEQNPDIFTKNIKYKFRSTNQISGVYLGHHLELSRDNAITLDTTGAKMLNGETDVDLVLKRKLDEIRTGRMMFTCLQGYEFYHPHQKKMIHTALTEAFKKAGEPIIEPLNSVPE